MRQARPAARVSIEDIARAGGVAHSTVSRALRNHPHISAATRARIQRLAQELGYTPDGVAQSLQRRRTNSVGLVVTTIDDPFFADVMRGVEEVARPAGISVFLNASHNDREQEIEVVETFHRRRVDGVLVAASQIGVAHAERLRRIAVPVVLINNQAAVEPDPFHAVAVDDYAGACLAVEHLLALGHRRIAYAGVTNRPRSNGRRLAGYRAALTAAGVPPPDERALLPTDAEMTAGDVAVGRLQAARLRELGVTAVCCYNDMLAIGMQLASNVPDELSVVGFDDTAPGRYVTPPLTTTRQPMRELGRRAMAMLLDLLDGREVEDQVLPPALVVRGSTRQLREEGA